jgi:hypothetical protein
MFRVLATCFLFFPLYLFGQRFGGTPPSVKWRQINTDSARIIYPAGLDSQAQRIASVIHYEASLPAANEGIIKLGNKTRKINIVLQNLPTIANGYVGLGPYRSEFYLTPPSNNFHLGSIPWTDQLALHEYRHVQQFNNFHNGLSQLMWYLFGQEGYALAINASIPDWFYEGDAVYNETVLSRQGRGRLPEFMNEYPSLWKANKKYSWMKLRNGSLKDYVPSHYNLGYLLVNYGYEKYGADFWSKVTKDASAFKGLFYPFQAAIKRHAGVDYQAFRNDAFEYYKKLVADKETKEVGAPVSPVNERVLTSYTFPYAISETEQVYMKSANNKRPAFFTRDINEERFLRVRDISIDDQFSYRNGRIVYAAYENDPRWTWREYSVIRLLEMDGQQKTITHKTRYFTPDISNNGEKIAAVHIGIDGKSELHILNTATGDVINRFSYPDIGVFTDPKFMSEDSIICAVRLADGKMALAYIELQTGIAKRATPPSFNVVGFPCVTDHVIYFTASYEGNDDVFAIKPGDPNIYRITNGSLGNYQVNVGYGKMTWSNFTAEGYQLRQADQKDITFSPVPAASVDNTVLTYPVSHADEIIPALPGNVPMRSFASKKYSKGTGLFNFHSWRPYYEDPEYWFSIYGENVLNTLQTEIYYKYDENQRTSSVGTDVTFAQLFPHLSAGTEYTFDVQNIENNRLHQFDQWNSRIGYNIPLSWTKGQTRRQFNIGSNYYYRYERNKGFFKDSLGNVGWSFLQHFISWSQTIEPAVQHIYPRLGYSASVQYLHAVSKFNSNQLLARAILYFPGVAATHNTIIDFAYQHVDLKDTKFGNRLPFARGYTALYYPSSWRLSANYHFPILYPDNGFGNIVYFQRLRGNIFFDYVKGYDINRDPFWNQRSAGAEVFIDTKWWNQHPLTFGFRFTNLLDDAPINVLNERRGDWVFEFILPVSIIPR